MKNVLLLLWIASLVGCHQGADLNSDPNASVDSVLSPEEMAAVDQRTERVYNFARSNERAHMPAIIDAMDDESLEVRRAALYAAEQMVGGAIPFRANDSPERRARHIDAYHRLWQRAEETNTEHLIDLVPELLDEMEGNDPEQREQAIRDVVLLTGITFGFRADQPPDIRQAFVDEHRKLWSAWSESDNPMLELKRHPEKLRDFRRQRRAEIKSGGNSAE